MNESDCGVVFVRDDDGHWYLIPDGDQQAFHQWLYWMENMLDAPKPHDVDYDTMRVEPEQVVIYRWTA